MRFQKIAKLTKEQNEGIKAKRAELVEMLKPKHGKDGADGRDGINGVNGKDGIDGRDGVDGKDGINGLNGTNGKDGLDGKDGENGLNGVDGVNGKDGKDGEDGRGISKAEIVKGNLIIHYTDGTKENVGRVVGKDGINGVNGRSIISTGRWSYQIQETSTSESINSEENLLIRQLEQNITTTLVNPSTGISIVIKNRSNGDNIIGATIDGVVNPTISSGESFEIVYNGTDWDII